MHSSIREPFQQGWVCIARKPFIYNGEEYPRDKVFPWKLLGVSPEKARKMYQAGYIMQGTDSGEEPGVLNTLSYKQLQTECKRKSVSASGTTAQLRERLAIAL